MCKLNRLYSGLACLLACSAIAAVLASCKHKQDAKSELEKTAAMLAEGEKTQPAPAAPEPAPEPQPAPAAGIPAAPAPPPSLAPSSSQQMRQALTSYKTGEFADAVTRLQRLRTMPTLTAQQRMAVQDSVAAVMNEIYEMAAKGDSRAIQAVKQYEDMQSAPR